MDVGDELCDDGPDDDEPDDDEPGEEAPGLDDEPDVVPPEVDDPELGFVEGVTAPVEDPGRVWVDEVDEPPDVLPVRDGAGVIDRVCARVVAVVESACLRVELDSGWSEEVVPTRGDTGLVAAGFGSLGSADGLDPEAVADGRADEDVSATPSSSAFVPNTLAATTPNW